MSIVRIKDRRGQQELASYMPLITEQKSICLSFWILLSTYLFFATATNEQTNESLSHREQENIVINFGKSYTRIQGIANLSVECHHHIETAPKKSFSPKEKVSTEWDFNNA